MDPNAVPLPLPLILPTNDDDDTVEITETSPTETSTTSTSTSTTNTHSLQVQVPIIIDGKLIGKQIQDECKIEIEYLQKEYNTTPGLAVVLVGNRPDSTTYVTMKKKIASSIGIYSLDISLDDTITQLELISIIQELNTNTKIHGILIQLPLPSHINESLVLQSIVIEKDVDGFLPINIGNLALRNTGNPPLAIPCTPAGIIELLQRYNIPISGKDCIIIGRSNIVGMPLSLLLSSCNGTVTICHSHTQNLQEKVCNADIIIAAIGKPNFIRGSWISTSKQVTIIDVGINSIVDNTKKSGYTLVGDVCYEECIKHPNVQYITPVPGGVGPMTIAMLMKNTINLTRHSLQLPRQPLRNEQYR